MSAYEHVPYSKTPCPFCGEHIQHLVDVMYKNDKVFAVECILCGARGPYKTSGGMPDTYCPTQAKDYWESQRIVDNLTETIKDTKDNVTDVVSNLKALSIRIIDSQPKDVPIDILNQCDNVRDHIMRGYELEDELVELRMIMNAELGGAIQNSKDMSETLTTLIDELENAI